MSKGKLISMFPKLIGIIPIKKNSERVPNKNFRQLAGAPLWLHAVSSMAHSGVVEEIIIETDFPEGVDAPIFPHCKVTIAERPAHLRGDDVSMNKIIESVMERFPAVGYLQSHATSPFLAPETISVATTQLQSGHYDSLHTVTAHQARFWTSTGRAVNHKKDELLQTQKLPTLYEENSALYIFTPEGFKETGSRIGARPCMYAIPAVEAIDIDTEDDWDFAEIVALGKKTALENA